MPLPLLGAHSQVITCSVLSLFNISKYTTFKPITRVCYSVYHPSHSFHLILRWFKVQPILTFFLWFILFFDNMILIEQIQPNDT